MRTSVLLIIAATLLTSTTFRWSELRPQRTLSELYREAKAGRLHTSAYRKIASLASWILIIVALYLALSGD